MALQQLQGNQKYSQTDSIAVDIPPSSLKLLPFSPNELLGKTFVRTINDGSSYFTTVLRKIQDHEDENDVKTYELGHGAFNEIMAYSTVCECIEDIKDESHILDHMVWNFHNVNVNQGLLFESHTDYKGSL
jgi:hypothetical protein